VAFCIFGFAILLGLGDLLRQKLQDVVGEARFNAARQACLAESLPPQKIVWESDAGEGARLRQGDSDCISFGPSTGWVSPDFDRLQHSSVKSSYLSSGCWDPHALIVPGADLFMHERKTQGGRRVLLLIRAERLPTWSDLRIHVMAIAVGEYHSVGGAVAGGFEDDAARVFARVEDHALVRHSPEDSLKIFAGQPDPNDESQATIRFVNAGREDRLLVHIFDAESQNTSSVGAEMSSTAYHTSN
jgi:hypothetical protein